eukprot:1190418-Prorocentrum_minimum.AAC.2
MKDTPSDRTRGQACMQASDPESGSMAASAVIKGGLGLGVTRGLRVGVMTDLGDGLMRGFRVWRDEGF